MFLIELKALAPKEKRRRSLLKKSRRPKRKKVSRINTLLADGS